MTNYRFSWVVIGIFCLLLALPTIAQEAPRYKARTRHQFDATLVEGHYRAPKDFLMHSQEKSRVGHFIRLRENFRERFPKSKWIMRQVIRK